MWDLLVPNIECQAPGADPGMGQSGSSPFFWQPNYVNSAHFWAISAIRLFLFTNLDSQPPSFTNPASSPATRHWVGQYKHIKDSRHNVRCNAKNVVILDGEQQWHKHCIEKAVWERIVQLTYAEQEYYNLPHTWDGALHGVMKTERFGCSVAELKSIGLVCSIQF